MNSMDPNSTVPVLTDRDAGYAITDGDSGGAEIHDTAAFLPYRGQANRGGVSLPAPREKANGLANLEQILVQQRNELRLLREQRGWRNLNLAAANRELQHLSGIRSAFVLAAAHELRTPLTSILGYLEMLLDGDFGPLAPEQRASLEVVQESARRLNTVANDLLDLARIEAGRIELLLRPVDLPAEERHPPNNPAVRRQGSLPVPQRRAGTAPGPV